MNLHPKSTKASKIASSKLISPNIIDIEASGFGSSSYPIEVGVITSDGRRFCRLIKPLDSWTHWDEHAQTLHGISRDILDKHGQEATRVCMQLNAFLQNATAYSDGWTVDSSWITRLFAEAGVKMTFHVSPLELILNEEQMSLWHKVKQSMMRRDNADRHRASNDAKVVQATYLKTREMINMSAVDLHH